jgi:hypothetical protein
MKIIVDGPLVGPGPAIASQPLVPLPPIASELGGEPGAVPIEGSAGGPTLPGGRLILGPSRR